MPLGVAESNFSWFVFPAGHDKGHGRLLAGALNRSALNSGSYNTIEVLQSEKKERIMYLTYRGEDGPHHYQELAGRGSLMPHQSRYRVDCQTH